MGWIVYISNNAKWVADFVENIAGEDDILESIALYYSHYGVKPDQYLIRGNCTGTEIGTLKTICESTGLQYSGYFQDNREAQIIIYHSKHEVGPNAWVALEWEIWLCGSREAWIHTIIPYETITDKTIKAGIEIFKTEHGCSPNTVVINPKKDELIFKIKKLANNNQLSAIAEYDVGEGKRLAC